MIKRIVTRFSLIISLLFLCNNSYSSNYSENSVLSKGSWVKVSVKESGVNKISYSTLKSWGFSNPEKVQVFGYGGEQIPANNQDYRPDDLPTVAVWHYNNSLYFYAQNRDIWEYSNNDKKYLHKRHIYSEQSIYFLSEVNKLHSVGNDVATSAELAQYNVSEYDYLSVHEKDINYIFKSKDRSGRKKYGEIFSSQVGNEKSFTFDVPNYVSGSKVYLQFAAAARSSELSFFNLSTESDEAIGRLIIPKVNVNNYEGYYAQESKVNLEFTPSTSRATINVEFVSAYSKATGWLDYISVNAKAKLFLKDDFLIFSDKESFINEDIVNFVVENCTSESVVWNITDANDVKKETTTLKGNVLSFVVDAREELKKFVVFNPSSSLSTPKFEKAVTNQNLHAYSDVEYVIVAPKEFESYALRLAELHREHNNINPLVVSPEEIFNEFSWGHYDPTAIRSFMRMLYEKADGDETKQPKYLLLFGNGYYSNEYSSTPELNSWVPTYQSENSINYSNSYVTDDYFGFLEPGASNIDAVNVLSIGVGRLPIRTKKDAEILVDKIEMYLTSQATDKWRQTVAFIGDDGDSNIHVRDSEELAEKLSSLNDDFQIEKVYLDSYFKTSDDRYPEAKEAIDRMIDNGAIVVNYIGHGNISGLSHELVITQASIANWKNYDKLSLFVTATCEFSRFDNPSLVSGGEKTLLNPNGGSIGLLTTTRLAWSGANKQLNTAFINNVFKPLPDGHKPRFGDIIKNTKNETKATINKLGFVLLGDPALKLHYPENKVVTEKINNIDVTEPLDTLKALSVAEIEAKIYDLKGNFMSHFNGKADVIVYDKSIKMSTMGNKDNDVFEYNYRPNVIFKGETNVKNGVVSFQFIVPFDIRYNIDFGRISYYAISEDGEEAMGSFSDFVIGGFNPNAEEDNEGPKIEYYLDYEGFENGEKTGERPILYASFFDESGINTTGAGIGHDIVLIVDGEVNAPIRLNDYYIAKQGTYKEGTIIYQLPELEKGDHSITLKAWDNFNNSSIVSIDFVVSGTKHLIVRDFNFVPNPVKVGGGSMLSFQSSEGNVVLDITVTASNDMGNRVGTKTFNKVATNNFITPISLSLSELGIMAPGFYIFNFHIESSTGKSSNLTQKIIVMP